MMEQTLYKGRHADSKPTEAQLMLLRRLGIKEEVIGALNREHAFLLIRQITIKYYETKFQARHKPKFEVYVRW